MRAQEQPRDLGRAVAAGRRPALLWGTVAAPVWLLLRGWGDSSGSLHPQDPRFQVRFLVVTRRSVPGGGQARPMGIFCPQKTRMSPTRLCSGLTEVQHNQQPQEEQMQYILIPSASLLKMTLPMVAFHGATDSPLGTSWPKPSGPGLSSGPDPGSGLYHSPIYSEAQATGTSRKASPNPHPGALC